ncbi:hypothetical protein [Streptomyces sp. NPDC058701]
MLELVGAGGGSGRRPLPGFPGFGDCGFGGEFLLDDGVVIRVVRAAGP